MADTHLSKALAHLNNALSMAHESERKSREAVDAYLASERQPPPDEEGEQ